MVRWPRAEGNWDQWRWRLFGRLIHCRLHVLAWTSLGLKFCWAGHLQLQKSIVESVNELASCFHICTPACCLHHGALHTPDLNGQELGAAATSPDADLNAHRRVGPEWESAPRNRNPVNALEVEAGNWIYGNNPKWPDLRSSERMWAQMGHAGASRFHALITSSRWSWSLRRFARRGS